MSTERPVDPETLERTKQEIRSLARQIAELSRENIAPEEYFEKFLQGVVSALAAVGGAIWRVDESGRLSLLYQINLRTTELVESSEDQTRHARLLHGVIESRKECLIPPYSGGGQGDDAGNPTRFMLVLVPLKSEDSVEGVVEIFQRPGASPEVQAGYLRFLAQMCDLANSWIKTRKLRQFTDRQSLWERVNKFSHAAHDSLDIRETAFILANESQRIVGCDRVSVAVRKGLKFRVEAVSGQDRVDTRSNMVVLMQKLVSQVMKTGEPLWYTGSTEEFPPQVTRVLEDYVDHAHSKTVAILPLMKKDAVAADAATEEQQEEHATDAMEIVGAVVFEQIEDSTPTEFLTSRTDLLMPHASRAMANAYDYNSVFLMPVWRTIGKSRWLISAKNLPKTLLAAAALLIASVCCLLIPIDFALEGKGELQPIERRNVFCAEAGVVTEVLVDHRDVVEKGAPLMVLRNTDLLVELEDVIGQKETALERMLSLQRTMLNQARLSAEERSRMAGELLELRQQLESLERQYKLLDSKKKELTVRSPIAGEIVTWDVEKNLINRPVSPGQLLMQVADPTSEWEVLVHMPEDNMGYITEARQEIRPDLDVSYIPATDPGTRYYGTVRDAHLVFQPHETEGHTVKIRVKMNEDGIPSRRPGATVTAQVHCGKRSIAFVWLHDVYEFIQSKVLF